MAPTGSVSARIAAWPEGHGCLSSAATGHVGARGGIVSDISEPDALRTPSYVLRCGSTHVSRILESQLEASVSLPAFAHHAAQPPAQSAASESLRVSELLTNRNRDCFCSKNAFSEQSPLARSGAPTLVCPHGFPRKLISP
jgi:hypothetical protein